MRFTIDQPRSYTELLSGGAMAMMVGGRSDDLHHHSLISYTPQGSKWKKQGGLFGFANERLGKRELSS